ncbi:chemotaxis protein CheW [Brucepastera parasyntrophica]|uniref:CheR family methyltransferase n=1 Tax=Brucepastera parasyntrophica TaxID=2880008 RepID=UPI00210A7F23|nr:CheR family methyltransferase [Brucepastera parasyntrophica]ULQ60213.1 chemotaxis protein CheW [Brucepastera parasyntrophica]
MSDVETKKSAAVDSEIPDLEKKAEDIAIIDFKMVTFSLAGKDYAIDIMQVKEIAKDGRFTYVPNTAPYVLGVYNLRGDIIPIIDLRLFFNIPTRHRDASTLENMIIIIIDEQAFGIVVDEIDKVVGISKNAIQPPHPLFGDINIKYIRGVVEDHGRLYILLDVERIFSVRAAKTADSDTQTQTQASVEQPEPEAPKAVLQNRTPDELDISFISDTLSVLCKFYVTSLNSHWVSARYMEWRDMRSPADIQLKSEPDARLYLQPFFSPYTGQLWGDAYADSMLKVLPPNQAKQINVWNIGCGKGYETYSLAVILKEKYPNARIVIYAHDSDLLAISNAPMLTIPEEQLSARYRAWMVKGVGGAWAFNQAIRDMILFEYHDCTNQNVVPNMDIILSRDTISFLTAPQQAGLIEDFTEKLKDNGVIILGKNEAMPQHSGWLRTVQGDVIAFAKE